MENRLSMIIKRKPRRRVIDSIAIELIAERRAIEEEMRRAGNISKESLEAAVVAFEMTETPPFDIALMRSVH